MRNRSKCLCSLFFFERSVVQVKWVQLLQELHFTEPFVCLLEVMWVEHVEHV